MLSVVLGAFHAAFGETKNNYKSIADFTSYDWVFVVTEVIFVVDIILIFFNEYKSQERHTPVRDIAKIAKRYLTTTFLIDFIPVIPFDIIFINSESRFVLVLHLFKVLRVRKAAEIIKPSFFSSLIKNIYFARL